jgi:hypothetical protein
MTHYLEHHRGRGSAHVVFYGLLPVSSAEGWDRLMRLDGLGCEGSIDDLGVGASFRFVTSRGDVLAGVVRNIVRGRTFSAVVEGLNQAIFNIELSAIPGKGDFLYMSLRTWGLPKSEIDALGVRLKDVVHRLFPQPTGEPMPGCAANS